MEYIHIFFVVCLSLWNIVEPAPLHLTTVIMQNECFFPPRYIAAHHSSELEPCNAPIGILKTICSSITIESSCPLPKLSNAMPTVNVTLNMYDMKQPKPDYVKQMCNYMNNLPWALEHCEQICGDNFYICDLYVAMDKALRSLFETEVQAHYTQIDAFIHPGTLNHIYPYPPMSSLHIPEMLESCLNNENATKQLCTVMAEVARMYVKQRVFVELDEDHFIRNVTAEWNPCLDLSSYSSYSSSPDFVALLGNCNALCENQMGICKMVYLGLQELLKATAHAPMEQPSISPIPNKLSGTITVRPPGTAAVIASPDTADATNVTVNNAPEQPEPTDVNSIKTPDNGTVEGNQPTGTTGNNPDIPLTGGDGMNDIDVNTVDQPAIVGNGEPTDVGNGEPTDVGNGEQPGSNIESSVDQTSSAADATNGIVNNAPEQPPQALGPGPTDVNSIKTPDNGTVERNQPTDAGNLTDTDAPTETMGESPATGNNPDIPLTGGDGMNDIDVNTVEQPAIIGNGEPTDVGNGEPTDVGNGEQPGSNIESSVDQTSSADDYVETAGSQQNAPGEINHGLRGPVYVGDDDDSDGHFMAYFLVFIVLSISGYILFHNKQKIIALVIEGNVNGGKNGRRPNTNEYRQLKTEDVMPSLEKTTSYSKDYVF